MCPSNDTLCAGPPAEAPPTTPRSLSDTTTSLITVCNYDLDSLASSSPYVFADIKAYNTLPNIHFDFTFVLKINLHCREYIIHGTFVPEYFYQPCQGVC